MSDVADIDHGAVDGLDRQVAERIDFCWCVVEVDGVLKAANFLRARRTNQILRGQRVGDILTCKSTRMQRFGVEIDLHLARLAAERKRHSRTRHCHQARADHV